MSNENSESNGPELSSVHELCLEMPLYREISFEETNSGHPLWSVEFFSGTIDAYCHGCGRHSVFECPERSYYDGHGTYRDHVFSLRFRCTRSNDHLLWFVFRAHAGVLQKIGQFPSLADLSAPDLRKYRTVIPDELYREFIRGVGLASHDVGIGAFVYLRRVFEHLIDQAAENANEKADWNAEQYRQARMDEKIQMLEEELPAFLIENRSMYSILSAGLHSLSEQECLSIFPVMRLGIELILDEELEKRRREEKVAAAQQGISDAASTTKKQNRT